ncbi:HDOD domain-containing protein [Candidatus Contendibacter odensensis]|uniref:histidine kinase n=1 Tax=Candidatus Contendobacter odensis Run_B_J11 TaxID=1400861 RepID=A0A7U7GFF3_9GAMM|nr:HDOD domain-containing protein [Candidatus Contendobacter odensis]CDH47412.1 putative Histidine kinase [Candidatus Contendobacter odensis Run_B_J11]
MPEASVSPQPFDSTDLLALPALPAVVGELLAAFDDENVDVQTLAHIIGRDAIISARMLTVANSAAYHSRAPRVSSLERTLTVLGLETAKTIALTTAIHQTFSKLRGIPAADMDRFWRHALGCAHLAQRLAQTTAYPAPDEAYLCGLLHDLGKLVIGVRHPTALQEVRVRTRSRDDIPTLERQLFGADHCELGATLVESWRLRSFLADAIRFHHQAAEELRGAHPLLRLLHVANTLSQDGELDDAACIGADSLFGLTPALLRQLRAESAREMVLLATSLGIAKSVMVVSDELATPLSPTRTRLDRSVQELTLVNGVQAEMGQADDETALLESVARCATILFDLGEVHFFLPEPQTGMLHSHDPGVLREFVIDPAGAENVVTRALRDQRISHSLAEESTGAGIVDRQLARLWGTDGVLCLPLHTATEFLGGLVAGVSQAQLPRLLAQNRLLHLFAAEVAGHLDTLRQRERRRNRAHEDRRLLEQQRLRAVLHEAANPLTILRNYLHLLTVKLGEPSVQDDLRVLREETERVGRILLRLSDQGGDREATGPVDLNATVRDLARVLDDALCRPRGIRLVLELADGIPPLAKGGDAIRQIVLNLVRNAAEALGQSSSGAITLATRDNINWHGRSYVELVVADNGPGLPDEQRARLFQPTTSAKGGEHAGLGLAIVRNLTEELDGSVSCRSNSGGGLIFQVLLPRPGSG